MIQVTPAGEVKYIAGLSQDGELGDGGPAQQAALQGPRDVAVAEDGTLYISDTGNAPHPQGRRRTAPSPRSPAAATRTTSATAARPSQASLKQPRGLDVAADGTLYIAESGRNRVRRIAPDGRHRHGRDATSTCPPTSRSTPPARSTSPTPSTTASCA